MGIFDPSDRKSCGQRNRELLQTRGKLVLRDLTLY